MSILLQARNLAKAYSGQVIFDGAGFSVASNQKLAVVGRNGAGKSTLFKMITGEEQPDSGEIFLAEETKLGYLRQEEIFDPEETVLDYLQRLSGREEWACAKVATKFDLDASRLALPATALSGGYQMRVKLTAMLLREPNLILLDEPTNYLDLSTLLLLEKFLRDYRGAYLIISHDRRFIAETCAEVLEVDDGVITHFPNKLEHYLFDKQLRRETAEKFNAKQEKKKQHLQAFVDRFGAKTSKATQAKSKEKQLAKIQTVDLAPPATRARIIIPPSPQQAGFAWRLKNVRLGYDGRAVVEEFSLDIEKGRHVAVLGDNGQGKSTFLKTLAAKLSPVVGVCQRAAEMKVAYYAQQVAEEMRSDLTVKQYLEAAADHNFSIEEIFRVAGNFLFRDDDLLKPISVLSGGEKSRLCLAGIVLNRHDVLLLDEPTNHLDFDTVEILARSLAEARVTIIFVSHDRMFIELLAEKIIEIKDGKLRYFNGGWEDYWLWLTGQSGLGETSLPVPEAEKVDKTLAWEEKKKAKREREKAERQLTRLKKERVAVLAAFAGASGKEIAALKERLAVLEQAVESAEAAWLLLGEKL